jgi:hypothetical protein
LGDEFNAGPKEETEGIDTDSANAKENDQHSINEDTKVVKEPSYDYSKWTLNNAA